MSGTNWNVLVPGAKAKATQVNENFDWIEGDFHPFNAGTKTDNTYDLGSSSFRWRDIWYSRQIIGPAGSTATPSFAQNGATTNGIYFPTTARVGVTNPFVVQNGSASAPSYSFVNSPTMGFYMIATNSVGFVIGGTRAWGVDASGCVTAPLQPAFCAYLTADQSVVSTNIISWPNEKFDTNADFSTTTFVAPVSGVYHFDVVCRIQRSAVGTVALYLEAGDNTFGARDINVSTIGSMNYIITTNCYMTAGASAFVRYISGAANGTLLGNTVDIANYFSGYLVG